MPRLTLAAVFENRKASRIECNAWQGQFATSDHNTESIPAVYTLWLTCALHRIITGQQLVVCVTALHSHHNSHKLSHNKSHHISQVICLSFHHNQSFTNTYLYTTLQQIVLCANYTQQSVNKQTALVNMQTAKCSWQYMQTLCSRGVLPTTLYPRTPNPAAWDNLVLTSWFRASIFECKLQRMASGYGSSHPNPYLHSCSVNTLHLAAYLCAALNHHRAANKQEQPLAYNEKVILSILALES